MSILTINRGFAYLDAGPMVDADLELVEPADRYVDAVLSSCHHPLTQRDMPAQARTTRDGLALYLKHHPRGHTKEDYGRGVVPGYTFWMRLRPEALPPGVPLLVPMAGSISLRIGNTPAIELYFGHIGYHVYPPARGRHYAARACRLLFPLARAHGYRTLWITCNPDNTASRRTCEHLGGRLVEILPVPKDNALYSQGDREKCRYRVDI
jgi:tagatose 1,6-diphosphate aldolase